MQEEYLEKISELFLTYGLRSSSMDEIATHLKISKKTLYEIFENKDDLVNQVMLYRQNKEEKEFYARISGKDPIKIIMIIQSLVLDSINSSATFNIYDLKKYHPNVYEILIRHHTEKWQDFITEILSEGIKSGLFRKDIDLDLETYMFGYLMMHLKQPEIAKNLGFPLKTIIHSLCNNFIRAMATPKGIEIFENYNKTPESNI